MEYNLFYFNIPRKVWTSFQIVAQILIGILWISNALGLEGVIHKLCRPIRGEEIFKMFTLVYNGPQFLFPIINRSFWLHDHLHTWCRECCKKATFKSFCKLISLFKGRPTHTFWSNCSELISVWMVWFVAQAMCNLQSFCWFGFLRQLAKNWCNPRPWVWWGRQGF